MQVTVLSEGAFFEQKRAEINGLSLYIKTVSHQILFNLGFDEKAVKIAGQSGIELANIDTVILSGPGQQSGVEAFLQCNHTAGFYLLGTEYSEYQTVFSGVEDRRVHPIKESCAVDENLYLFSEITQTHKAALRGASELHLIVTEETKHYLFTNYAHQGTIRVLEEAERRSQSLVCGILGGFYFYNREKKEYEDDSFITLVVDLMKKKHTLFYTSHESGAEAFGQLRDFMQDNMKVLKVTQAVEF